jgi:hypothetical protein
MINRSFSRGRPLSSAASNSLGGGDQPVAPRRSVHAEGPAMRAIDDPRPPWVHHEGQASDQSGEAAVQVQDVRRLRADGTANRLVEGPKGAWRAAGRIERQWFLRADAAEMRRLRFGHQHPEPPRPKSLDMSRQQLLQV